MGTTRIKIIDLSGQQQIKTSRKHAEKLSGFAKINKVSLREKKPKAKEEKPQRESVEEPREAQVAQTPMEAEVARIPKAVKPEPQIKRISTHHRGKKYQEVASLIDKSKVYETSEALDLLAKSSPTKFDGTVEIHLNVTDKNLRGSVNFPHALGAKRQKRYLVFTDKNIGGPHSAKPSGVLIIWATDQTIADIETGKLKPNRDFDALITSPKYMPSLAKIAKILGPAGLMPSLKDGTITQNPQEFIAKNQKSGGVEFKTDPTAPIIHTTLGKLSTKPNQLEENLKALILKIGVNKIKKATISSTMGPGIKIDPTTISA